MRQLIIIVGLTLILSLLSFSLIRFTTKEIAEPLQIEELPKTLDEHIEEIFKEKSKIAKAVIFHESNNKLDAKGYNCIYNKKSTFCKKKDRHLAWSVDCGIGQINVKGKVCPASLFTLKGNMIAVEKIYKKQGLNAWVSYKTKAYLRYL